MNVDETTVRRIARLARIKITDEEAKSLEKRAVANPELGRAARRDRHQSGRADDARRRAGAQEAQGRGHRRRDRRRRDPNAPMAEDHFYVVPKVVE